MKALVTLLVLTILSLPAFAGHRFRYIPKTKQAFMEAGDRNIPILMVRIDKNTKDLYFSIMESALMKEFNRLLSIRGISTTPYHLQCNGMVERFNGTLKTMLRKLCEDHPKDWDRYIPAALFAYRSVPQESTGLSPFELIYAHRVKTPIDILKAYWSDDMDEEDESKPIYKYILDLQDQLRESMTFLTRRLNSNNGGKGFRMSISA